MAALTEDRMDFSAGSDTAISQEFDAVPRAVRQVREAVAAFAARHGAAGEGVEDIRTAVSEAATNVVMHAYDADNTGRFRVLAVVGGDQMLVIIDDDGCGLSEATEHPGLGLGLRVMEQTSEQALFLTRERGGSTVQLRFRLASAA
jgi:stage II sporulation protein AB (anti-sigma F factor)